MTYQTDWYHGRRGSLDRAIERFGSLYLTDDPNFAENYGNVYEIELRPGLEVFDTSDPSRVEEMVRAFLTDWGNDELSPNLDGWVARAAEELDDADEIEERLAGEFAPDEIRGESAYDDADFQEWLSGRGFDLVTFYDEDTALLLNAREGIARYRRWEEDDY